MNWTWIPQLHHDFIGRIVPGAAIIGASVLVAMGPEAALCALMPGGVIERMFTLGPIVLAILVSYLLGLLLGEVWRQTIGRALKKHEKNVEKTWFKNLLDVHSRLSESCGQSIVLRPEDLPRSYVMRSHLRDVVPADVSRLLKLRAERRLCHVLIVGLAALAIANLWLLGAFWSVGRLALEISLVCATVLFWLRSERLLVYFMTGTCSAWLAQLIRGTLPFTNAARRTECTEGCPADH